jgi:predicted small lipoprotein YifL
VSFKKFQYSLVPFALLLALAGCEKQGPIERAGEEIDEAVEDVRAGGETTGNKIDDAVDEVREAADDVRKDLE